MKKITAIIATSNKHKLEEINEILCDCGIEIKSMKDVSLEGLVIVEDGGSFEANAIIKAKTVMNLTNSVAIADDSGLEVLTLGGRPGVDTAIYAGENATDIENNRKLLRELRDVPYEERKAKFVCVIAVAFPSGETFTVRGECEGIIALERRGNSGFGYDPLFVIEEYNLTLGELGKDIKNKISHRANALKELKKALLQKTGW
ncbi:MAG: XTP/dITP diphosphatase [Alkaliphilus sp.]